MTLNELEVLLYEDIKHSRPVSREQLYAALMVGRRQLLDLVRRTRPEWLVQEQVLAIAPLRIRFPLTGFGAVRRIKEITALGPTEATLEGATSLSTVREVRFAYASIEGPQHREALSLQVEDSGVIYYDLIFPQGVPTLAIAPAQRTAVSALVSYFDEPARWTVAAAGTELLPVIADREALVRAWAMEWLCRQVNDVEASAWRDIAARLAIEATEDIESVALPGEAHDTDLYFGDL